MPCTTILVGKNASYDGSTMIARNDDSGAGHAAAKKFVVVKPKDSPKTYHCVISHLDIPMPKKAYRYTAMPNCDLKFGVWAACGVNEKNVGMSASETITTNPRVVGADPFVRYEPAKGDTPEKPGGIGEEDLVAIVLPYISSAREGVVRLGELLETYGTYESNGIAFSDQEEIWYFESIGGHHWMARRVPDEAYVVMPNQLGIDYFDFEDAYGEQKEFMCSKDLREFVEDNHLDLTIEGDFDPRAAFGSHDDSDHVYNTPRAWYMLRYFNPHAAIYDGEFAELTPQSDDLPWCMVPEKKITAEDVKYILSSHFQGTPYDPYNSYGDTSMRGAYRTIGINRTDFFGFVQIRGEGPKAARPIEWVAYGSNAFNAMLPFYTAVNNVPQYLGCTTVDVSTDSFYWSSRLVAALADAAFATTQNMIERYQNAVQCKANAILHEYDTMFRNDPSLCTKETMEEANNKIAAMAKEETDQVLARVLQAASDHMRNSYARNDF